jgi:hypothetical protein
MTRPDWSLGLLLLCGGACSTPPPPAAAPTVTAEEARAIRAAEELLLSNGYGKRPANLKALEFDAAERVYVQELGMPVDSLLLLRHNTVCFPAYGIAKHDGTRPGWTVFFRPTRDLRKETPDSSSEPSGRGVEVSVDFSQVHLMHMDARLRAADKVLHPNLRECPIWVPPPNKGMKLTKPG